MKSPPSKEIVNRSTGERIVFLRTARETGGALLEMDDFWAQADHRTPEHVHPAMEERWEVIAGSVRFEVGGVAQTAAAGGVVVAPPGTPPRLISEVDGHFKMTGAGPDRRGEEVAAAAQVAQAVIGTIPG